MRPITPLWNVHESIKWPREAQPLHKTYVAFQKNGKRSWWLSYEGMQTTRHEYHDCYLLFNLCSIIKNVYRWLPGFALHIEARKFQLDGRKYGPSLLSYCPNSGATWDGLWRWLWTCLHKFVTRCIVLILFISFILFVFFHTNSRQGNCVVSS